VSTDLARIEAHLGSRLGLDPAALGRAGLLPALRERVRALGSATLAGYADRLEGDPTELRRLAAGVLVHETWFFRYPASFDLLADEVLGRLAGRPPGPPIRILSAACATGEEPASIAMALLHAGVPPERFVVDALDLGEDAIKRARAGWHPGSSVRAEPPAALRSHLAPDGKGWRVAPAVLDRVRHRVQNLLDPGPLRALGAYPIVFCRNALIYLLPEARERLHLALRHAVEEGGLLFVGHSEVAGLRAAGFAPIGPPGAFALRRAARASDTTLPRRAVAPRSPLERHRPARRVPLRPAVAPPTPPSVPAPPPEPDPLAEATRLADEGALAPALALLEEEVQGGRATAAHFHLLGVVHSAAGRPGEAEGAFGRALYLDPRHYGALVQAALLAEDRGEFDRARRLLERARRAGEDA
jgi:chemotaxis protein methyltransferase WspC